VNEKKVSRGDFVKKGAQLFVVIRNNPVKLDFTVDEKDAGLLKKGQDAVFRVEAYPDREFAGRLGVIYPSLEERSRSLKAEASIPNPDGLLKPGFFARVTVYIGPEREMVVVPVTAILYDEEKKKVFVVEGERAHERVLELGGKYGEMKEVTGGLGAGELVVTAGQQGLAEGIRVNASR
jgi:membrane fusion protein (multidrug efflux system)